MYPEHVTTSHKLHVAGIFTKIGVICFINVGNHFIHVAKRMCIYIYTHTRMSNIGFDWLGLPMHKTWTSAPEPEGTTCSWDDLEKLVKCRFVQWTIYMRLTMYVIHPPVFYEVKRFIYYSLNYLLRTLKEHLGTVAKFSKQGFKTRRVISSALTIYRFCAVLTTLNPSVIMGM